MAVRVCVSTVSRRSLGISVLSEQYSERWHIEESFNRDQSIGWKRAGTQNLDIRYDHLAPKLLAQAAVDQFRRRLPADCRHANAGTVSKQFFNGLDDDRQWRQHYEQLPARLEAEKISPTIPWLYDFELNFRFR